MKIVSWNVAGLRAMLKKDAFETFIKEQNFDIICIQETKAEESQVNLPAFITEKYLYRYWNSTKGTSQRKGFSGTTIWCPSQPIKSIECPFDDEGRVIALEFERFILVNVYVPNSQKFENGRYYFRNEWNKKFTAFIGELKKIKEVIICGDMNVAHNDIDISNPKAKKNKVPGFFDNERAAFTVLLETNGLVDVFRNMNLKERRSTYWSNFLKAARSNENGWRIDYFLITEKLKTELEKNIDCRICMDTMGSDHCPVVLEFT